MSSPILPSKGTYTHLSSVINRRSLAVFHFTCLPPNQISPTCLTFAVKFTIRSLFLWIIQYLLNSSDGKNHLGCLLKSQILGPTNGNRLLRQISLFNKCPRWFFFFFEFLNFIYFFIQQVLISYPFFFKHLYWSIIALQWCVSFCFITKWISYAYTYVSISLPSCVSLPPTLPIPPL